jgi:hypothetical protein
MLGYGSAVINGQLINVPPAPAYAPLIFGADYVTGGMWPRQGVYNVPPVLPSPALQSSMAPATYGATGTYPYPTATSMSGNPYSLKHSPVIWVLLFLAASLLMLHYVHWS